MTGPSIEHAYATACQLLGQAQVEAELLTEQLGQVAAERDEAGARVVELTAEVEELRNPGPDQAGPG